MPWYAAAALDIRASQYRKEGSCCVGNSGGEGCGCDGRQGGARTIGAEATGIQSETRVVAGSVKLRQRAARQ